MDSNKTLNLFYQEPDPDRWIKHDRYPRRIIRRLVRGKPLPGGQKMVFLNLTQGLDKIGISYRVNDFKYIQKHPEELACIIGKPNVLFENKWENPILFGASIFSHPIDHPDLLEKFPIKKVLVPGEWMQRMFKPYYGQDVIAWPVGIDTDRWRPSDKDKNLDFLIYYKIRWKQEEYDQTLVTPIIKTLEKQKRSYKIIRYGHYVLNDLTELASKTKAVIFLCEHETQGLAYQQLLSMNIPIFAWDRGGFWEDPAYFPDKVQFNDGVSSVPYWDERCGFKFSDYSEFLSKLDDFLDQLNYFSPRDYILENLTLEKCAKQYLQIVQSLVDH
ncbi:MAG: glycosyltransferase [Lewinellaceae bacterium]|nr:glycosyltransferase [Lewinellaceae bacterium]